MENFLYVCGTYYLVLCVFRFITWCVNDTPL